GHYQLVAAHAMTRRGVLIQKIGDQIIEPKIEDYSSEEAILKELIEVSKEEEIEEVPRLWLIKTNYKKESLLGAKYVWKEFLGALSADEMLLMENYALPHEEQFLREAIGFGAYISPDIHENLLKLLELFAKVPEMLVKIGDTAFFLAHLDNLFASHYWNIKSFTEESNLKKWKKQFIRLAIKAYKKALQIYSPETQPLEYAKVQNDLGSFYLYLSELEAIAKNCRLAIKAYKEALNIYSLNLFRYEYSIVNYNLALAYQTLAEKEDKEINIKLAIFAYQEAAKGRDLTTYPFDYSMTLVNQGVAYLTLATISGEASYSTFAIDAFSGVLRIGAISSIQSEQAMIYNNLGVAYKILATDQEKEHNCKQAMLVLNDALTIRNPAQFPFEYAVSITILGDVYRVLAEEKETEENCKLAISSYDKAIKIFITKYEPFYNEVIERKREVETFCKEKK
ncbi:MAG: hypothetical protein ACTSP3_05340, partial [Candidatus Heimdallarchaeaceae archaeon]